MEIKLSARRAATLENSGISEVFLLVTQNGRSYYRMVKDDGHLCFGAGPAGSPDGPGVWECWLNAAPPNIIDLSVYEANAQPQQGPTDPLPVHLWRLEGLINNDNVSRIVVSGSDGAVLAQVPVVNDVFYLASPPTEPVSSITAYYPDGQIAAIRSLTG